MLQTNVGNGISRRSLLKSGTLAAGVALASSLLQACASAPAPAATPAPAPTATSGAAAQPSNSASPTAAATIAAQTAPTTGTATLSIVWRTATGEQTVMNRLWGEFQQQNPNIKIDPQFATGCDVDKKIELLVAAGTSPALWSSIACQGLRYYASRDKVVVLDDYIKRDKYDLTDFYDAVMPLARWKGQMIGFPVLQAPTLLVYNQDILDKAGVPYPTKDWSDTSWTWDKWLTTASKLVQKDSSGKITQYAMDSLGDTRYSALRHHGTDWFDLQGILDTGYPTTIFPDKQAAIDALQFDHDLMYKDKVIPLPAEVQAMQAGAPNVFQTGKIAMTLNTSFAFQSDAPIKAFKWSVGAIPAPNKLKRYNYMYPDQYTMLKPQKYEEQAWVLLKFMTSAHGYQGYPIEANGGLSPRKSLEETWSTGMMQLSNKTKEEVQVGITGMQVEQTAWGHPSVEYDRFWSEGIKPSLDKLLADEIDAKTAVDQISVACQKVLDAVKPK